MSTYRMEFVNTENIACKVDITVDDSASNIISIAGGTRPFILREFNTDMDYYKPIRPMMAEIQILAANGLNVDVFINATDVNFYYGGTLYWFGKVIQDEFQEYWIDTEHLFTIRATDNFDKQVPYPNRNGLATFLDVISNVVGDLF